VNNVVNIALGRVKLMLKTGFCFSTDDRSVSRLGADETQSLVKAVNGLLQLAVSWIGSRSMLQVSQSFV
jgi:hypothetical protein